MTTLSDSEKIWQKYKERFRKTDYYKYLPKKFYEPINIDKENEIIFEQTKQKQYENQFPYYEDLPRLSRKEMFPHKGISKIEHFGYFGIFVGVFFGKAIGEMYYGINEIQHFDEVSNRYFDLKYDAFKDVYDIKYNDQRIEKKDYKAILKILEQRKLQYKKKQLYDEL